VINDRRIPSLDGLRAISITFVVFSHLIEWKHIAPSFLDGYGLFGVFVFFVLSGYLITKLLLGEYERTATVSLKDFYIRRAFRILPAAFVFLTVATILFRHEIRWYHLATAVFYFANMDPSRPFIFWQLWSLSVEEQFYLLWPFATPMVRCLLYAAKIYVPLTSSLPVHASALAIGCLLAIYAPRIPRISGRIALVMSAVALLIPAFVPNTAFRTLLIVLVLSPVQHICVAGVMMHVIRVPYRALNWGPVVWLGRISYSLYLWQQLIWLQAPHWVLTLVVPAFACAIVSYYLVEQPALRLREFLTRRNSASKQALGLVEDLRMAG
jgi:peptidoglycan/LPS O-acetylase OafA/YrhL